ncbi:hypothetical protein FA15DRAFT_664996 [Coprinopsis marcescibilis]|uniref:Ser-Thr-rich glycosyl-phosphatidyl-inositol-anchored membrane family-domain-containing protein n=1 Tax=Coprinopsis marcescibilis TaxID=230819 RepID=A0A5C3L7X3_COPMA|nr:hypothetical protein FA15DRAFT_664996 [Coprinopsis marcescibilis]
MRFFPVALLAFASSALGYTILFPNEAEGWTDQGPQVLTWHREADDRLNFTVVLSNPGLMGEDQILAALVDGTLLNTTMNPPDSGSTTGWPSPGSGYIVRLVAETTNVTGVLAQSTAFEIEEANITTSTRTPTRRPTSTPINTEQPDAAATDDTLPTSGALSGSTISAAAVAFAMVPALFL